MTALLALLPMLLSLLSTNQSGGSNPSGGAASISSNAATGANPLTSLLGGSPGTTSGTTASTPAFPGANLLNELPAVGIGESGGDLLGNLFGLNQSPAGAIGAEAGGALLGPLAAIIGDLIGNWVGGGIPTEAKTSAIGTALGGTGNSNDALISRFINREVNAGNPLSNNATDNAVRRFAAMVQALTGQGAPGATATGFNNNPTFNNPSLGTALDRLRIPQGYEFASSPAATADIYKDLRNTLPLNAGGIYSKGGEGDWQTVVRELIQQGALQKYQGPLGAAGGGNTASGAIPNVSLPHPLTNQANPAFAPAPYPV